VQEIKLKIHYGTHPGFVKARNEDSLLIDENNHFFAVADGMSEPHGGDQASQSVIELLELQEKNFFKSSQSRDLTSRMLRDWILNCQKKLSELANENKMLSGFGTTLTGAHFEREKAHFFHIGDSRVYLLRENALISLTSDHTVVGEEFEANLISEQEWQELKNEHSPLTKVIFSEEACEPDLFEFDIKKNDVFLFCTDGLTKYFSDESIVNVFENCRNNFDGDNFLSECLEAFMNETLQAGAKDNVSLILIQVL